MVSIPASTPEQANQSCMRKVGDNKDVVGVRDKSLTAYPTVPKSTVSHFNEVNRWFAASSGILEGLWDDNNRVHVAKQSDVDGRLDSGSGATWLFLLPVHPIFNAALLLVVGCQSCFLSRAIVVVNQISETEKLANLMARNKSSFFLPWHVCVFKVTIFKCVKDIHV